MHSSNQFVPLCTKSCISVNKGCLVISSMFFLKTAKQVYLVCTFNYSQKYTRLTSVKYLRDENVTQHYYTRLNWQGIYLGNLCTPPLIPVNNITYMFDTSTSLAAHWHGIITEMKIEALRFSKLELTMAKVADDGWNDLAHITGTVWETCNEMRVKNHEKLNHHAEKNNFTITFYKT
jgi:hypothetical protein